MYLSTFKDEEIRDTTNLVIRSLFILAFISPREDTNSKIENTPDSFIRGNLEAIRYNPIVSKYSFFSLINPLGYNLISKNLVEPEKRLGVEEDFLMVETDTLHKYFQVVDVISNTIALN